MKKSEDVARESEEFNTQIIESSRDCINVLDLNGRLLSINTAGMRLFEISDFKPPLHCPLVELFRGADREAARTAVEAAKTGEVGEFMGFCPTMSGRSKWC
ncbi:MAG: PAS domain-containing protein [Burkholderiales bacterium]